MLETSSDCPPNASIAPPGRCGNVAAILELDEHLQREFIIFEAAPQETRGIPSKKPVADYFLWSPRADSHDVSSLDPFLFVFSSYFFLSPATLHPFMERFCLSELRVVGHKKKRPTNDSNTNVLKPWEAISVLEEVDFFFVCFFFCLAAQSLTEWSLWMVKAVKRILGPWLLSSLSYNPPTFPPLSFFESVFVSHSLEMRHSPPWTYLFHSLAFFYRGSRLVLEVLEGVYIFFGSFINMQM